MIDEQRQRFLLQRLYLSGHILGEEFERLVEDFQYGLSCRVNGYDLMRTKLASARLECDEANLWKSDHIEQVAEKDKDLNKTHKLLLAADKKLQLALKAETNALRKLELAKAALRPFAGDAWDAPDFDRALAVLDELEVPDDAHDTRVRRRAEYAEEELRGLIYGRPMFDQLEN